VIQANVWFLDYYWFGQHASSQGIGIEVAYSVIVEILFSVVIAHLGIGLLGIAVLDHLGSPSLGSGRFRCGQHAGDRRQGDDVVLRLGVV
jgi:hypothetical protein